MEDPRAHPGVDYAFSNLANDDDRRTGSAIADLAKYTSQDARAAIRLNELLHRAGHAFFYELAPVDQKMLASVLARAALVLAEAYPAEAHLWNNAAKNWREFADAPLAKTEPAPGAARNRSLRGMFR